MLYYLDVQCLISKDVFENINYVYVHTFAHTDMYNVYTGLLNIFPNEISYLKKLMHLLNILFL